jgi:hypothetical protein
MALLIIFTEIDKEVHEIQKTMISKKAIPSAHL